jgi:hypothetical protein
MTQVVKSAKDGVDSMIETGNAISTILSNRPPTRVSQEAKSKLDSIGKQLTEVRDILARERAVATSPRSQRASTRYAQ